MLQDLGATGLLMEYEDMFPFTGAISNLSAGNAYEKAELSVGICWNTHTHNITLLTIPHILAEIPHELCPAQSQCHASGADIWTL